MKNIFAGVKIFWFHSRAIARGRCEHGQARRPFAQVGDVFIDDDVVDDEKLFIIKQPSSASMHTYL